MDSCCTFFFFQAEDGIRDLVRSRGLGDVYKRQGKTNKKQLLDEKAFMINLDTIKDLEHMTIGTRETLSLIHI